MSILHIPVVLVVEDDRATADVVSMVLQQEGYVVKYATNGQYALNLVRYEKPDLMIMDVMMPVMDGYTLAVRLAESEDTRGIPILVITAKGQMEDMLMMAGNVVGVIQKPFNVRDLRDKVKKVLADRGSASS